MRWKKNTDKLHVFSDEYSYRFVEELDNRCTAFKFFIRAATYSDRVVFWYKDFETPEDAVQMAKNWLLRTEVQNWAEGEGPKPFTWAEHVAPHKYEPEIESRGW